MAVLLVLLLLLAMCGVAFIGFYAFQLRIRVAQLDAELASQRARYAQDMKQWNDYSVAVKAQHQALVDKYNEDAKRWNESSAALRAHNLRLSKWQNVADAEVRAAEIVRDARATLEKANADANGLISSAQQRATALMAEA
jgi:hypothetical protein